MLFLALFLVFKSMEPLSFWQLCRIWRNGKVPYHHKCFFLSEWLVRTLAVWEVSGSLSDHGGHKILCGHRKLSDCVSFRGAVKRQQLYTLKYTVQGEEKYYNNSLQTLRTLELDLGPFPTGGTLLSSWMIRGNICCKFEKGFASTWYT